MPLELKPQYSATEFRHYFPQESEHVEFKSGIGNRSIGEAVVAMSNTDGGVIFVGIGDDGRLHGQKLSQGAHESINEAVFATHDAGRFSVNEIQIEGSTLIAIRVHPRGEGFAQTSDGRTLVRVGPRNQSLFGSELQSFLSRRSLNRFESTQTSIRSGDVDDTYRSELYSARHWPDEVSSDRLVERGLAKDGRLTLAGALLLTDPSNALTLQKCVVEVRRYPREGVNYDRREVFSGPLHHQVRDASLFISRELGSDLIVSGVYRFDLPKLPEVVVREAVANAVAHRDYERDRSPIVVELRDDRVVVRSPGGLPDPVTVETMRVAQAARNPVIIENLRAFSLTEDAGRGVDIMQDTMRDELLNAPAFEDSGSFVTVTLPLLGPITSRERAWVQEMASAERIQLSDRLLVVHAARGEALSNSAARELLGLRDPTEARRVLQRLRDAGVFQQVGERSSARYVLADRIQAPAAYRMSQRQLRILIVDEAREHDIVNADVRRITGMDTRAAGRLLASMVQSRQLIQIGERRGARYTAR